jgi:hypothetical protein
MPTTAPSAGRLADVAYSRRDIRIRHEEFGEVQADIEHSGPPNLHGSRPSLDIHIGKVRALIKGLFRRPIHRPCYHRISWAALG